MRRVLGAVGLWLVIGGMAALVPLFATIGAGVGMTGAALGLVVWRAIRRRSAGPGRA